MRIKKVLLLVGCAALLAGCGNKDNPGNNEKKGVLETKESFDSIELINSYYSLRFDKNNGSLMSLKNNKTKTDYILSTVGGNWAMNVDIFTENGTRDFIYTCEGVCDAYINHVHMCGLAKTQNLALLFGNMEFHHKEK